jgi:hypothetical protein
MSILSSLDVPEVMRRFLEERGYERVTDLCRIMQRYGSDKGLGWHNYTSLYQQLFEPLIGAEKSTIFELGIGTNKPDAPSSMGLGGSPGASLRSWAEWLPLTDVYGADIDQEILFEEGRIRTFYVDQRSADAISDMWKAAGDGIVFDAIIDDGLHEAQANDTFLCASHHKLKKGGIYVIEDILPQEVGKLGEFIKKYVQWFRVVLLIDIPSEKNCLDNRLMVMQK